MHHPPRSLRLFICIICGICGKLSFQLFGVSVFQRFVHPAHRRAIITPILRAANGYPRTSDRTNEGLAGAAPVNIRYYIDAETERPHIHRHGVAEHEVQQVLSRPTEDRPGKEGSRVVIGRTLAGRHLRVIYTADSETAGVFVVTAYELRGMPLTAFKRRMRRKTR